MAVLRRILVMVAALVVGLTPSAALELGMAAPGERTLVICSEAGAVSVTLDADGNPVEHAGHSGHDCCLIVADLASPPAGTMPVRRVEATFDRNVPVSDFAGPALPIRQSRGPPGLV
jgi:hypothetical protein